MRVDVLDLGRYDLAEGPHWNAADGALWWVDINGYAVWRARDGAAELVHRFDQAVGCVAPRAGGGFVAGLRTGIATVDAAGTMRWVAGGPGSMLFPETHRMNDGKVDAQGRLWVGSTHLDFGAGPGALYRVDPDGSVEAVLPEVTFANGMGWSPDGGTFHFIDTIERQLLAFDFDPVAGRLSGRRVEVAFPDGDGAPDGLAVDAEGGVWVAQYGASRLDRFVGSERIESLALPALQPTCPGFAGEALDELWVTTCHQFMDPDLRDAEPANGSLLRIVPGVRGLPTHAFAG